MLATTVYMKIVLPNYPVGGLFLTKDINDPFYDFIIDEKGTIFKKNIYTYNGKQEEKEEFYLFNGFLRLYDGDEEFVALYNDNGVFQGIKKGDISSWIMSSSPENFIDLLTKVKSNGLSMKELKSCLKKLI